MWFQHLTHLFVYFKSHVTIGVHNYVSDVEKIYKNRVTQFQ